jgi:hypothetical protein
VLDRNGKAIPRVLTIIDEQTDDVAVFDVTLSGAVQVLEAVQQDERSGEHVVPYTDDHLPQSSSVSRFTAAQAGFFDLIQCVERPELYRESLRFDTMPSNPSLQACLKTVGPSSSMCSLKRRPGGSSLEDIGQLRLAHHKPIAP